MANLSKEKQRAENLRRIAPGEDQHSRAKKEKAKKQTKKASAKRSGRNFKTGGGVGKNIVVWFKRQRYNILLLGAVAFVLFVFVGSNFFTIASQLIEQRKLRSQIVEETARGEALDTELKEFSSKSYTEYQIRKQLGMVYPDEKIVVQVKTKAEQERDEKQKAEEAKKAEEAQKKAEAEAAAQQAQQAAAAANAQNAQ